MFVSTNYLAIHYGIDDTIAKFFVDREPPANNLYWKDKLLFLRFEPGFLFIPLIVDTIFKLGVQREQLLSEDFVQLMEGVGHISALEETKRISQQEAIEQCTELARKVSKNDLYLQQLIHFFSLSSDNKFQTLTTGFNALHRGDLFLFSLCALNVEDGLYEKIVQYWFAIISSLLLLDDAEDVEDDLKNNEENAFIESGIDEEGLDRIKALVRRNLQLIATVNKTMANRLDSQLIQIFNKPYFQQLHNQN